MQRHPCAFARKLEFLDIEPMVETCHLQLLLEYTQGTYRGYTTRKLCETRLENLEHLNLGCTLLLSRMSGCLRHFAISIIKDDNRRLLLDFGPRTWIRRETTDKIIYLLGWLVEVDTAGLLEIFGADFSSTPSPISFS